MATGKSSAKSGGKKRSACFLAKGILPAKPPKKGSGTYRVRHTTWRSWKHSKHGQRQHQQKTRKESRKPGGKPWFSPCWAPSSITCSFDVSCPPANVLVEKAMRSEGVSLPDTCAMTPTPTPGEYVTRFPHHSACASSPSAEWLCGEQGSAVMQGGGGGLLP